MTAAASCRGRGRLSQPGGWRPWPAALQRRYGLSLSIRTPRVRCCPDAR
ncbi:Uncharacterised protein [Bordetella pertussis]|nr:Uncharacterised protein [Bordetella pertussis]